MRKSTSTSLVTLLALAFVLAFLPSCKRNKPIQEVRVGYFANLSHAQALLGVSSGEFERALAPLALKTRVFNAGPSLVEAIFANELDIGYLGPGPTMTAHGRTKGAGLRVIAGASANGVALVVRSDLAVTRLEELRGKRIATPQLGNTQDVSARHFLTEAVGKDGVKFVPAALAEHAALMERGEIDGAWVPEPWAERLVRETKAKIVLEERDLWPSKQFPLALVVTTPEFLEAHPDVVERFLAAHASLTERLAKDPAGNVAALTAQLSALSGKKMSADVVGKALERVTFTLDPMPSGLDTLGEWTHQLGFEKMRVRAEGLVDTRALERSKKK